MYTTLSIPCSSLIFIPPRVGISIEIAAVLKTAFEAIWTAPGRLLASILDQNGVDVEPQGAVAFLSYRFSSFVHLDLKVKIKDARKSKNDS